VRIGIWHWTDQLLNGDILRAEPRGGTETAVVYTCEALAALGHEVVVFCNTPDEATWHGVEYRRAHGFRVQAQAEVFDIFGVVRHLIAFTFPVKARATFYWCHDNLEQPFTHGALRVFENTDNPESLVYSLSLGDFSSVVDRVLAVSHWQAGVLSKYFSLSDEKVSVIGNGLQPNLFSPELQLKNRKPILLYSLPPDRGMGSLLEVFPRIRSIVPEAELHLYSQTSLYGESDEYDQDRFCDLLEIARTMEGVRLLRPIPQRELAQKMSEAMLYVYPAHVNETFCISLLEAQAAGTVPISTEIAAISERIENTVDGFLLKGNPWESHYQKLFIKRTTQVLLSQSMREMMAQNAHSRAHSAEYQYETVAKRLLDSLMPVVEEGAVQEKWVDLSSKMDTYRFKTKEGTPTSVELNPQEIVSLQESLFEILNLA